MTHWSNCFYTHENFTLITYNISFIFTYLLHSGWHSTLFINARVYQQLSAPCLWNWSLSIKKKKNTSLHDRLVFNTLYPPVNKLFLSVTKFSLYISPYISFLKLVPMTYVLPFLRVLLRRLRMPHELSIGWAVFDKIRFFDFSIFIHNFCKKTFSSWYLGWIFLVTEDTYPRNMD